ncbi:Phospholipase C C [Cladobotryum mycophilum]|uniref:Phospholipase C C n=1 Tax=Cladobotryum mycophilum TaxID=491253 RepID=A0ABR0SXA6_9HYPO
MPVSRFGTPLLATWISLLGYATAGSLKDIDHVVLFMQENRAFDHYFGTMAGVRGFNDANLQMNGDVPVWQQLTPSGQNEKYVNPWYINYLGGNWSEATQCMLSGSNAWYENHVALNGGANDHWAKDNNPASIGFFKRQDLPLHFALADNFLVADMYQEAVVAATNPNRVTWISGSINVPGGPQTPDQGGNPYIDNNASPGCDGGNFNCYPLKWKTTGEYYEDAGTNWQVFQDTDNFDDNAYARFEQFQDAKPGSSLFQRGLQGQTLNTFYERAANGTLPEVSYIVGPMELSEHPPFSPNDGAWLQHKIAQAVLDSPKYNKTVLMISYDETGGWFDHVNPYKSPDGTAGEWIDDPYHQVGHTFAGPGFRLPFYIISPFTRKGGVYTGHADHNSQILFVEKWQAAKGRNVRTNQMVQWRRDHMSDLVEAFDFENPDYSIPSLPSMPEPHRDANGNYDGSSYCESRYPSPNPPVPYTGDGVVHNMSTVVEKGFKPIRGKLTEGRFLVFEMFGAALSQIGGRFVGLSRATSSHDSYSQRWIVHALEIGGDDFRVTTCSGLYICSGGSLCSDQKKALVLTASFAPSKGYAFNIKGTKDYLVANGKGVSDKGSLLHWQVYSVNY